MAIITKEVTKRVLHRVCDFCGSQEYRVISCFGCGRDVCKRCATILGYDPWTNETTGDYPPYVCARCNEILPPFMAQATKLRTDYEAELKVIEDAFCDACKVS